MLWTDRPQPDVVRFRMARTLLGRPVYKTACYLVGDTLIDTGCPNQGKRLLAALADPIRTGRLRQVVVTHHHEDHTGNAFELARAMGRGPHASAFCADVMADRRRIPFYRRFVWGRPKDQEALELGDKVETSLGPFKVVPTPGHTPGDVAFHDEERGRLFTGDLVQGATQTVVRPGEDIAEMTRSTARVAALDAVDLFGAHRTEIGTGAEHLHRRVAFLTEARERVLEAVADEPGLAERPRSLARRMFGSEPWLHYVSLGDFSRTNFVRSILRSERMSGSDKATTTDEGS
ncbi:MAG: MBL fold metallo-hydrolase [Euryarchaeota archaeon]|nr:MBL fold metallo-hydrolase [Euryarchaeota archaeon]